MKETTAQGRYSSLSSIREPYLHRARKAAELTIPSLMPPEGHTASTQFITPYQGLGARGVNNLASKILLALMPPNAPFFRMQVDDYALEQMTQEEGQRAEVEKALGKIERAVMTHLESIAARVSVGEALKQLLVAGNVLLHLTQDNKVKVFTLNKYVVKRDPSGNVLEIVVIEAVSPDVLPDKIREKIKKDEATQDQKTVDLFTRIHRKNNQWHVYQEAKGIKIPGTSGTYPLDKSPWIPLRFTKVDGEDYGRGYIEEYYGDLKSLEALQKAIVEGSAAAAKILILVNPNGTTRQKDIAEAPNGAVRAGDANDVTMLQLDKYADFRIAFETANEIKQRLSYAFLMNTSIQRQGERVTAEEIRYMAGELEDALGGVYSVLSQEFQQPLVSRVIHDLERKKKIPALPDGTVTPTITTGLEALGRGHDLNKLDTLMGGVMQSFGPEAVAKYVNIGDYITRRGTALGIDMAGLIRSQDEVNAEDQAAQQQAMMQQLQQMVAQGGVDTIKEVAKEGAKSNG